MTQPAAPIERLYTRALSILGIVSPGSQQLVAPLSVQNVQLVGDLSDVAIPHSNPLFGTRNAIGAPGAGQHNVFTLTPTRRIIRIWTVSVEAGTTVRMGVLTSDLAGAGTDLLPFSLGPIGDVVGATASRATAGARVDDILGTSLFGTLAAFGPEQVQWNTQRPTLIAPGQSFTFLDTTANSAMTVGLIWEEIPEQTEVDEVGFPEA